MQCLACGEFLSQDQVSTICMLISSEYSIHVSNNLHCSLLHRLFETSLHSDVFCHYYYKITILRFLSQDYLEYMYET